MLIIRVIGREGSLLDGASFCKNLSEYNYDNVIYLHYVSRPIIWVIGCESKAIASKSSNKVRG